MFVFYNVANNIARVPLTAAYVPGSGTMVLGTSAASFPAPPFRITAITQATYGTISEVLTIFSVSAIADASPSPGNCTLTLSVGESTVDRPFAIGDLVDVRVTAGSVMDLNAALESIPAGSDQYIQFNKNGFLGTSSSSFPFTYNYTTNILAANKFSGDGSLLTNLNASNLVTGIVDTARLGSGTANNNTYLRGDHTWATPPVTLPTTPAGLDAQVQFNQSGLSVLVLILLLIILLTLFLQLI